MKSEGAAVPPIFYRPWSEKGGCFDFMGTLRATFPLLQSSNMLTSYIMIIQNHRKYLPPLLWGFLFSAFVFFKSQSMWSVGQSNLSWFLKKKLYHSRLAVCCLSRFINMLFLNKNLLLSLQGDPKSRAPTKRWSTIFWALHRCPNYRSINGRTRRRRRNRSATGGLTTSRNSNKLTQDTCMFRL